MYWDRQCIGIYEVLIGISTIYLNTLLSPQCDIFNLINLLSSLAVGQNLMSVFTDSAAFLNAAVTLCRPKSWIADPETGLDRVKACRRIGRVASY